MYECPPPYGIPITHDIHVQLPTKVITAWEQFHVWWQNRNWDEPVVKKADLPPEILQAMLFVLPTPIPGYEGSTLADSCYWIGVLSRFDESPIPG